MRGGDKIQPCALLCLMVLSVSSMWCQVLISSEDCRYLGEFSVIEMLPNYDKVMSLG